MGVEDRDARADDFRAGLADGADAGGGGVEHEPDVVVDVSGHAARGELVIRRLHQPRRALPVARLGLGGTGVAVVGRAVAGGVALDGVIQERRRVDRVQSLDHPACALDAGVDLRDLVIVGALGDEVHAGALDPAGLERGGGLVPGLVVLRLDRVQLVAVVAQVRRDREPRAERVVPPVHDEVVVEEVEGV